MRLVPFLLLSTLALGCRAEPPPAEEPRERVATADEVRVTVYRAEDGAHPSRVVRERAELETLADLLEFEGPARRRRPGALATTVAADLDVVAADDSTTALLLRADLVFFGPGHEFEVELASDSLYRHLRALVGAD